MSIKYYHSFFTIFAIFFFVQRFVEARSHKKIKGNKKAQWLTRGLIGAHFLFFLGSILEVYTVDRNWNPFFGGIGAMVFVLAFFLRRSVIKTLGLYWSIDIEMRESHPLIKTGPFQFCRHPNYLAIILELIGFCLIANAFITLIVSLPIYVSLLMIRIKLEETELRAYFGDSYRRYANETPILIPRFNIK